MDSFTVTCACGERFHAGDRDAGRSVRCRKCNRVVELVRPPVAASPGDARSAAPGASTRSRRRRRSGIADRIRRWSGAMASAGNARMQSATRHRGARQRSSARALSPIGRTVGIAVSVVLAVTIVVAILMWGFGDIWWPATFLLFVGRWIYLLPPLVLAPAVAIFRPRLLGVLVLDLLLVLGPVMGGHSGWRRLLPAPDGMPLRVVSFNADGGRQIATMLPQLLATWDADVVLLQECGEELAAMTERIPGLQWHHVPDLCLMTRYPIVIAEQMDRSALARLRRSETSAIGGAGYVVRYTLRTPGGNIGVTNLHLETPRKGFEGLMARNVAQLRENTALRDFESMLARRWFDGGWHPMIVAGDFNTTSESRIFQQHWGGLRDAFARVGTGFGYSKYNGWIRVRIDHVLTDDEWTAVRVHPSPDIGSDHRPVLVDLVLRR